MPKTPSPRAFIAAIRKLLPKPVRKVEDVDESTVLIAGNPGEVIVRVSESSLVVFEFAVEWAGPDKPEVREIPVASLAWPALPKAQALAAAAALIEAAKESRRSKYRKCRVCREMNPPEWLAGKDVCQACASEKLAVVH
jgi:hypothetical protein